MSSFRAVLKSIENALTLHGATWSELPSPGELIRDHGPLLDPDIPYAEASDVIQRAITSNGESLVDDLARIERRLLGQNFPGSWWDRRPR